MKYQIDLLSRPAISINDCALILGLSYQTIRRRCRTGEIRTLPHTGNQKILIITESLKKYLNGGDDVN
jgi:predicted site-specific integrase-resolvase